jgi:hypothetical protein
MTAPASGVVYIDNVFLRQIPAPTATNWTTFVPFGSTWRYYTNTPPANWVTPGFDDSSWRVGTAKFGAGGGPTNIATPLPQLLASYYFRKQFVAASSDIEELLFSATCTDDSGSALYPLRVFLNGKEIATTVDTVTSQGNVVRYLDLTPFASLVQPGTNTLAVLLSNYWSSWDDVAFDVSLKAVVYHPVVPRLWLLSVGPGPVQLAAETPAGTIWSLESSDTLQPFDWQLMETFTNTDGGVQTFRDMGPPQPYRFYRLRPE